MTYEEAKMQIQAIPEKIWDQLSEPDREAMEMAFSALQAQDSPKPTAESVQNVQNEDLILRKAAIEALGERPMVWTDDDQYALGERNQYDMNRLAIETLPSAQPEPQWIPVSERLPEEDHWLGGSGKQFSDNVLISITNHEDAWSDISQTIDGEWRFELPRHCKITAWKPLPEPYRGDGNE